MTATDELRRLLDERGVEHVDGESMTYINDADFIPAAGGTFDVTLYERTPAQAIDATLGRGECRWIPADYITEGDWWNTSCGESFTWEPDGTPRYCHNCGRRVRED